MERMRAGQQVILQDSDIAAAKAAATAATTGNAAAAATAAAVAEAAKEWRDAEQQYKSAIEQKKWCVCCYINQGFVDDPAASDAPKLCYLPTRSLFLTSSLFGSSTSTTLLPTLGTLE